MTIAFERPIGAPADVKELEYVSSLSQTAMPDLRTNGSLYVEDVVIFLISRHGIQADPEVVQNDIMTDLAGDLSSDPSHAMDICQIASILLLPHFKKVADSNDDEKIRNFFGTVLGLLLAELPLDDRWYEGGYKPGAYPILSVELLQELLAFHGEINVPPQILENMVRAAGDEGQVLDVQTLIRATTSDLDAYDVCREALASTHYEDAIQERSHENSTTIDEENHNPTKEKDDEKHGLFALKRKPTFSNLDLTAETYGNKVWVALSWLAAVLLFFAFMLRVIRKVGRPDCTHLSNFTCKLVSGITQWLILFVQLSVLGFAYIALVSMGNSVYNKLSFLTFGGIFAGIATVALTSIVSFFVTVQSKYFSTKKYDGFEIQNYTILVIGITLICFQILELIRIVAPSETVKSIPYWKFLIRPSTVKLERSTKVAAAHKVDGMVNNALLIHEACSQTIQAGISSSTKMGSALLSYQSKEHDVEPCGGILWAWKKIYDGTLYKEEGVWLHARLIASNIAQLFVAATITVGWGLITFQVINAPDDPPSRSPTTAPSSFVPTAPQTLSPFWAGFTDAPTSYHTATPTSFHTAYPTAAATASSSAFEIRPSEVNAGVSAGAVFAVLTCLSVAAVYLPSAISTILKFRSGVFPSLRSKEFLQYRFAADQTTTLLGSAFWGALFAGLVCWVLSGVVVYLLISKNFTDYVIVLFAQVSGIVVTLIIKIIILLILRRKFFAAFYRTRPGAANIMSTILECWNIGLSTLYMIIRSIILLVVTAVFIARVDTPLLAPGVGQIGPIILDGGPFAFRKDLLLHEAHRHPYIERLGFLYMMKLRHGESFATRAGSCWRLLFTLALMPWFRKYRIRSYGESSDDNDTAENGPAVNVATNSFKSSKYYSAKSIDNESLELEVESLRKRVRELEDEIARGKLDSFRNEPLSSSSDKVDGKIARGSQASFQNEPLSSSPEKLEDVIALGNRASFQNEPMSLEDEIRIARGNSFRDEPL